MTIDHDGPSSPCSEPPRSPGLKAGESHYNAMVDPARPRPVAMAHDRCRDCQTPFDEGDMVGLHFDGHQCQTHTTDPGLLVQWFSSLAARAAWLADTRQPALSSPTP